MLSSARSGGTAPDYIVMPHPVDGYPFRVVRKMRKRAEFLAANSGRRYPTSGVLLLVHNRRDDDGRMGLGITVTKKIGNAVTRNRMKRRYRAIAAELLPQWGIAGADHVFIARHTGVSRDFGLIRSDVLDALRRAARS